MSHTSSSTSASVQNTATVTTSNGGTSTSDATIAIAAEGCRGAPTDPARSLFDDEFNSDTIDASK